MVIIKNRPTNKEPVSTIIEYIKNTKIYLPFSELLIKISSKFIKKKLIKFIKENFINVFIIIL